MRGGGLAALLGEPEVPEVKAGEIVLRDCTKLVDNTGNFYQTEDLSGLIESIRESGVKEPVLIRKGPNGEDVLVSGHRRTRSSRVLVTEEGREDRRWIPCMYDQESDLEKRHGEKGREISEGLTLIEMNSQRIKTPWERMMESVKVRMYAKQLKELGEIQGKTRQYAASKLGISQTQVQRFWKIHDNLSADLLELFKRQLFPVAVAEKLADLPAKWQEDAALIAEAKGGLTTEDAEKLEKNCKADAQIEGQMTLQDLQCQEDQRNSDETVSEKMEKIIIGFYKFLTKEEKKLCEAGEKLLLTTDLYQKYKNVSICTAQIDFQGEANGATFFAHRQESEHIFVRWPDLVDQMTARFEKTKVVRMTSVVSESDTEPDAEPDTIQTVDNHVDNVEKVSDSDTFTVEDVEKELGKQREYLQQLRDAGGIEKVEKKTLIYISALELLLEKKGGDHSKRNY